MRVIIDLDPEVMEQIENYRYGNRIPTRVQAVRELLEAGLEARGHPVGRRRGDPSGRNGASGVHITSSEPPGT